MAALFQFISTVWGLLLFLNWSNAGPALSISANSGKSLGESGLNRIKYIPLRAKASGLGVTVSNIDESSTLLEPRGHSSSEYEYHPVHYATYAKFGGYNPYAIIGISVFGVLGLILFLQLIGIQTFRSITNSPFSLPTQLYNLSEDLIPELMLRVSEMLAETSILNTPKLGSKDDHTDNAPGKRSIVGKEIGIMDWIKAYRKDQTEYQCIRKLACEVLANSNLAVRSVKSSLGNTLLSVLGRALEDGSDVVSLIQSVVEDPEKCMYLAPDDMCNDE